MSINHRISIIAPVYNVGKYLDCFFENMIKQTYQDFKIFCVYDTSTDNSLDILKKYEKLYPDKVEVIISLKKNGLGAARDLALDSGKVKGEYVLFLDPDDYPEINFLEKMIHTADKTKADITICGFDRFDDETGKVYCVEMTKNKSNYITDVTESDTIAYVNPAVWNKLYRYSVIENSRFTEIKRAEDLIYLIRILPKVKSVAFINEVLYHYRVRYDSLSNTIKERDYDEFLDTIKVVKSEYNINYKNFNSYISLLELMVFIHAGVSFTYRLAASDKKSTNMYIRKTKDYLDENFPGWSKNKYLNISHCIKGGVKKIGLWGCRLLYKINMFKLFISFYNFIIYRLKVDIKW